MTIFSSLQRKLESGNELISVDSTFRWNDDDVREGRHNG